MPDTPRQNIQIEIKGDVSAFSEALKRMSEQITAATIPAMQNLGRAMAGMGVAVPELARAMHEQEQLRALELRHLQMSTRPLLIMPAPEVIQRGLDTLPLVKLPDIGEITEPAEPVDESAPARVFRSTDEE